MLHKVLVVSHKIVGMFKDYSDYIELENKINERLKDYPNYHITEIKYNEDTKWISAILNLKVVNLCHELR